MRLIYIDAETYGTADLERVGALNYASDPETELLGWSVAAPGVRAKFVTGIPDVETLLRRIDPNEREWVLVHWGQFDRLIAERFANLNADMHQFRPTTRLGRPQAIFYGPRLCWVDLRQRALQVGLPATLDAAAEWAGAEKLPRILVFSKPQKGVGRLRPEDDPVRWEKFSRYAARDTGVLDAIAKRVDLPSDAEGHARGWRVVERMNQRGFPVDVEAVKLARLALAHEEPKLVKEFEALTGGIRPTQTQQFAEWLGLPGCSKDVLTAAYPDLPPNEQRAVEIRLEVGSATRHKLAPLLSFAGADGRLRYAFSYHGAWTRRLTAQGAQPQNFHQLPEDKREAHAAFFRDLLSRKAFGVEIFAKVQQHIRGFIATRPGRMLVSADFSQIELRIMAWLAGETWLLNALAQGNDVYIVTAGAFYGVPPKEVNEKQRKVGKMVELASQFGLSAQGKDGDGGLYARAKAQGVAMTRPEAERAIQAYRSTHRKIEAYWHAMSAAFIRVMQRGKPIRVGKIVIDHPQPDLIRIIRPSGRFQCFWSPRPDRSGQITYIGRMKNGRMGRVGTYGARLAQGTVQGTAADLLLHAMDVAEARGFAPVLSVHDEIVAEVRWSREDRAQELCWLLRDHPPKWAEGIPVDCDGWQAERFQ